MLGIGLLEQEAASRYSEHFSAATKRFLKKTQEPKNSHHLEVLMIHHLYPRIHGMPVFKTYCVYLSGGHANHSALLTAQERSRA
mmetsp:Transcript_38105/g.151206  ORF Transcript_38105/g.151206 Transcript_38105/m.151206 type:complete len:84 (+) Transcript_38105:2367-2618(+)